VIILLIAGLVACSDGLSAGADDPLADRVNYIVYGITNVCSETPPPIPHGADVGLRHLSVSPFTFYIYTTTSDEETGYYEFPLNQLDTGWYTCDAWFVEDDTRWQGSCSDFHWISGQGENFERDICMFEVE